MWILGAQQMRQRLLRNQVGATCVDPMKQIEPLHRRFQNSRQTYRARIIDADIEPTEFRHGLRDSFLYLLLIANVAHHRQRVAARRLNLLSRGVNRPWQRSMRRGRLGRYGDVRAITGRAQGDRQPDAARTAADEDRLATKSLAHLSPLVRV